MSAMVAGCSMSIHFYGFALYFSLNAIGAFIIGAAKE